MKTEEKIFAGVIILASFILIVFLNFSSVELSTTELNLEETPLYKVNADYVEINLNNNYGDKLLLNEKLFGFSLFEEYKTSDNYLRIYSDSFIENGTIQDDDLIEINIGMYADNGAVYKESYKTFKDAHYTTFYWQGGILNTDECSYKFNNTHIESIIELVRRDIHDKKIIIEQPENLTFENDNILCLNDYSSVVTPKGEVLYYTFNESINEFEVLFVMKEVYE